MVFEFEDGEPRNARMKVVGVGGAGGNAVNRMVDEELEGVDFIAVNTDAQALNGSAAHLRLQIGKALTRGLGAGARPEIGRQAIAESEDEVRDAIAGADLVFVTAGMGGGTGTGAAPAIGRLARELGALCIAIVSRPFHFEGKKRMRQAQLGLRELRREVDTMIVVPNERLLSVVGRNTTFGEALKKADEVLLQATRGISDLISVTGEVNVDFADVRTVMSSQGGALMGTGSASGEDRAVEAAQQAICSPLLDNVSINGATGVLINITGGPDMTIDEVTTVNSIVHEAAGEDGELIFGVVHDAQLEGTLRVTVIATGFGEAPEDAEAREPSRETRDAAAKATPAARRIVIGSKYEGPHLVNDGVGNGASEVPVEPEAPVEAQVPMEAEAPADAEVPVEAEVAAEEPWSVSRPRTDFEDLEIPTFIRRQMD